jgi:3-dehydroquinate synthetase
VEIPTSFTHQTDGTLSHKQAINGRSGKNHFGLYHAPIFTWTDTQYLSTEPLKLKNAGLVEGIKNALIDQPSLLPHLRRSLRADGHYSAEESTDLAYKIILSKLEILAKDPSERNFAIVLEYGHTFAHAIEWLAAGTLIHGECVSIGMRIAARLAESLGAIDGELARLHEDILDFDLEMRPALPASASADAIIAAMKSDNKRTGSDLRFVLLEGLGRCANREGDWLITVPDAAVKQILEAFLSRYPTEKPKVPARAGRRRIRDLRIPTIGPSYTQPALGDRP